MVGNGAYLLYLWTGCRGISRKEIVNKKAILALITTFLLTEAEQQQLANAIYDALRSSMIAAYRWSCFHLGNAQEWYPSQSQEKALEKLANTRAAQIAATYEKDITRASETFLDAYEKATGSLEGAIPALRETLQEYTDARTELKQADISQYEVAEGSESGMDAVLADIDTIVVDESVLENIYVGVLPVSAATEDICAEWAGECCHYTEVAESSMPEFPAHLRCPHYRVIFNMETGEEY